MPIYESIKRLFKHSVVYGIGHIVTRSIGFLLLPMYTNIFPRDDFGVAGLMFTYLAILMIIYTYGLDVALFRFYILEENERKKKCIFTTALVTILATSVIFSGILFFGAESIAQMLFSKDVHELTINLPFLIRLASGILIFDALAFLPFQILRAEERSLQYVIYKFLNVIINVTFNIIFLGVLKYGIEGIFIANIIASLTTFLMLAPIIIKHLTYSFSKVTLNELFAFGLPYLPSTLFVVLMDTVDRVFLERLANVEAVGLYNAGAKLGMFMALYVAAFRFAWHPFFLSTSKQEDAKEVFAKVFTYVLLACFTVFLLLSLFINDIARFRLFGYSLIGEEFWDSTVVVPVIMLAYIFYAAYLNFLIGIYLYKKTKYLPYITFAGVLGNLLANYTLIPHLGILGAAWARLVAYLIMAATLYVVAQRLYFVRYEWLKVIKLCVVAGVIFALGQNALVQSNVLLKTGLFIAFPIALLLTGLLDRTEINKMRKLTSNFIPAIGKSK
ncbi:MAG: lipopolysaccharide biosynthesis protein [bacterium]